MYRNTRSSMLIDGEKLEEFDIEVGVRQGCVLSPTLFSMFFEDLTKVIREAGGGVEYVAGGEKITSLFYADDIVIFAESKEKLEMVIGKIMEHSKEWKFTLNKTKTQVVIFGTSAGSDETNAAMDFFTIDRGESKLKVMQDYKYLGMDVHASVGNWKKYKDRMIEKASRRMNAAWGVGLQSGAMSVKAGVNIWQGLVRPILEYGAEIWPVWTMAKDDKWTGGSGKATEEDG